MYGSSYKISKKQPPIEFSTFIWYNNFHKGGMFMDNPIEEKEAIQSETETPIEEPITAPIEDAIAQNLPAETTSCGVKKGPKAASYVFFALAVLTFIPFIILTMPFLSIFFDNSTQDVGEALGKIFGALFTIVFMFVTGVPNLIFSLISTIFFGTEIGKSDPKNKTKSIVFFVLSLLLVLAVVTIALFSVIVLKRN